jgi:hypothetical protein
MTYRTAANLAPQSAWFKSSFSGDTGNNCIEVAPESAWFKSSYSQENGTACVEVADLTTAGRVAVRDSKDKAGPALVFSAAAFADFVAAVREGRFDG